MGSGRTMPQTISAFWLLLRKLLFSRKEILALPLERTYSLQNHDISEDDTSSTCAAEAVYFDFTIFWFDDSIIDSVDPPEHLQMIRPDTNDDDDEEEDDITDGG